MTPTDPTPRDVLAAALPDVMSEETCLAVMGPGIDRLDCAKEWYMAPREMADSILATLADAGWSLTRSEPDPLVAALDDIVGECEEWTEYQHGNPSRIIDAILARARAALAATEGSDR
jgi:hypothetical protein